MRAAVQRVSSAKVTVGERVTGEIDRGLLVLLGVEQNDGPLTSSTSRPRFVTFASLPTTTRR